MLVGGDEWAHVEALDPDAGYWARRFAQLVNWREAVGLTNGILIGFSMVVPAALVALVVLLRGAAPATAAAE